MNVPLQVSDFNALKKCDKPIHLAIGVFDGVHLGHLAVIEPQFLRHRIIQVSVLC